MWNFFKKKKKMENIQEIDLEILDKELKPFVYKWMKGEMQGKTCIYESVFKDATTGIIWVNFKDGSRINYSLLNEFMIQLDNNEIKPPVNPVREANTQTTKNIIIGNSPAIKKELEENPIISLLQKQKPNWVEVGISLKLNLPTKDLYNVLTSSFEDAEEQIIEFVVNDLDIELIKESLRINIKEIYKNNENSRKSRNNHRTQNQEQGDN